MSGQDSLKRRARYREELLEQLEAKAQRSVKVEDVMSDMEISINKARGG